MQHSIGAVRGALSLLALVGLAACSADSTALHDCPESLSPAVSRVTVRSTEFWGGGYLGDPLYGVPAPTGHTATPPDSLTIGVTVGASIVPAEGGRLEIRSGSTVLASAVVVRGAADPIPVSLTFDWRPFGLGPVTLDIPFVAQLARWCPAVPVDRAGLSIDLSDL